MVTPSLNQGRFLEETLRSVLLQGYPELEYVVMDGGSSDGSVEIILRYQRWLAHWARAPDRGQSHAVNAGWASGAGEIVGWVNSDDLYLPRTLEIVAREFSADPGLAVLGGETRYIDEAGRPIGAKPAWSFEPRSILVRSAPGQPATFFRRTALEQVGLLDERLHYCMDRELALRLGDRYHPHGCLNLPIPLAASRIWADTKQLTGGWRALRERLAMIDRFLRSSSTVSDRGRVRWLTFGREFAKQAVREQRHGRPVRRLAYRVLALGCSRGLARVAGLVAGGRGSGTRTPRSD